MKKMFHIEYWVFAACSVVMFRNMCSAYFHFLQLSAAKLIAPKFHSLRKRYYSNFPMNVCIKCSLFEMNICLCRLQFEQHLDEDLRCEICSTCKSMKRFIQQRLSAWNDVFCNIILVFVCASYINANVSLNEIQFSLKRFCASLATEIYLNLVSFCYWNPV